MRQVCQMRFICSPRRARRRISVKLSTCHLSSIGGTPKLQSGVSRADVSLTSPQKPFVRELIIRGELSTRRNAWLTGNRCVASRRRVLTDVESVRGIALRGQWEAIVVLVRLQMPDAAFESGPHRKSLQTGRISGSADEERLAERNPREQALQLKPEFSSYTYARPCNAHGGRT